MSEGLVLSELNIGENTVIQLLLRRSDQVDPVLLV
jgi:hypothetical protein